MSGGAGESVTRLDSFEAPYGRRITLEEVAYASGMRLLRLRIREGRRFTVMDLDRDSATRLGDALGAWAGKA